jgi:hypothetical protein
MAQRSLHDVTKIYYGSYAKLCQGSTQYHSIAKVSRASHGITAPLAPCVSGRVTTPISHSTEQGTLPTTSLIITQVVPYRTCGGTCCPGVSTPKTRSLADSSMTNHKPWKSQPSPLFQTLLKAHHHISPWSPHITTDERPTHSTQVKLNIIKMERLVRWFKTTGLSNTTNHKNPILKYDSLGNQLMHTTRV